MSEALQQARTFLKILCVLINALLAQGRARILDFYVILNPIIIICDLKDDVNTKNKTDILIMRVSKIYEMRNIYCKFSSEKSFLQP